MSHSSIPRVTISDLQPGDLWEVVYNGLWAGTMHKSIPTRAGDLAVVIAVGDDCDDDDDGRDGALLELELLVPAGRTRGHFNKRQNLSMYLRRKIG